MEVLLIQWTIFKYTYMKATFIFSLIGLFTGISTAYAEGPAVIPQNIQQGATPEKALETFKGIFQIQTPSFNLKSPPPASPSLQQSLKQVRTGTEAVFKIDSGLRRLNAEIKSKLGIDIPVLVGALWDGIVWIVRWVAGFLGKIALK